MNHVSNILRQIEAKFKKENVEIDVFIEAADGHKTGYCFVEKNQDGTFEVTYSKEAIPAMSWDSEKGIKQSYEIFNEGEQAYSTEDTFEEAIEALFDFWNIPKRARKIQHFDMREDKCVTLVLSHQS